jgi:hypothetical protein
MDEETQREIDAAVEQYYKDYVVTLTRGALRAYLVAAIETAQRYGRPIDEHLIQQAALDFSVKYGAMLTDEGASIINGEKKSWLSDSVKEERQKIVEIIQRGIAEGKAPGVKERVKGGYTAGTIAADLEGYFQDRRSHASTVARSEVRRIQNLSRLDTWDRWNVQEVDVLDGGTPTSCEECNGNNGQRWTTEYARIHELTHPNCVITFVPVIPEVGGGAA